MEKTLNKIVKQIENKISVKPKLAIILGSGLGDFASSIKNAVEIPYEKLNGMPKSTVKGHSGKFIVGEVNGVNIIAMKGRLHLYEGYSAQEVTLPIYIFKKLGVETLLVTNAAGGVNKDYNAGDLMIINDQINFTAKNPLVGKRVTDFGVMFVEMSDAYNKEYIKTLNDIAKKQKLDIKNGTYIQFLGPTYETPAEVRMAESIGADACGMSTAVEVVAATHCGLKTAGISAIANKAVGTTDEIVSHEEVLRVMAESSKKMTKLVHEFIKTLA